MSYTIRLTGFTLGVSILNVDLYACTGSLDDCTNNSGSLCTGSLSGSDSSKYFPLVGYSNIPRSSLNGTYVVVPEGIKTIRVIPSEFNGKDGDPVICVECVDYNNLTIRMPTTPTPTPTTTPTPVPTATPTNTPTPPPTPSPDPATYTPTPSPTPEPATYTPTPSPSPTPSPTPTEEPVDIETYYYYRLGDCQYMGYSYTSITFNVQTYYGCTSEDGYNGLSDPGNTSYYVDETNPCGFSSGYTYTVYGKSLKSNLQIPR